MAENMHLKDLTFDVKHLQEMMEARDKEYSTHFKTIESINNRGDTKTCSVGGL